MMSCFRRLGTEGPRLSTESQRVIALVSSWQARCVCGSTFWTITIKCGNDALGNGPNSSQNTILSNPGSFRATLEGCISMHTFLLHSKRLVKDQAPPLGHCFALWGSEMYHNHTRCCEDDPTPHRRPHTASNFNLTAKCASSDSEVYIKVTDLLEGKWEIANMKFAKTSTANPPCSCTQL